VHGTVKHNVSDLRIGYLPQKNMIDSNFPVVVRDVIKSGLLGVKGLSSAEKEKLFNEAIEEMDLVEHADRPIGLLSGGQLQRALLGRAIISHPQLLVLDEPLSYIDKRFESRLYKIIERLAKTTTIVLVSHEMSTIAGMANRHFIVDVNLHECTAAHHYIRTTCDE
jgi:zinc transport system ATP-binding protein